MAKRSWRKLAILAKIETSYGVDAVPTGGANAILGVNVTHRTMVGEQLSRDLLLPYLGHQGVILDGVVSTLEMSVEIAGSGAAGTAPAYGPLLRMCGMAETIVAATSVAYAPVSAGYEAGTIYFNQDGVRKIMLGARGTVSLELVPGQIPRYRFMFTGLLGTITDTALPAVTLTGFIKPVPVNADNTTLSLHATTLIAERFSLDLAATVEKRWLIGEKSIQITDRKSTGSVVVEAGTIAAKDWYGIAKAHTTGALAAVHGLVAGNIVTIGAPAVQIGLVEDGQTQGIINNTLPLMFLPVSGNDELSLTFT
ncbi:MAG: phage tail tube protein [Pseudomonadota bacterium]